MAGRKPKSAAVGRSDFAALLADVKGRIQAAQTRAVLAVNAELVRLYWDIGQMIEGRQRREGWGAAVIPRLARELKNELPELKGFSERNIDRMIAFYRAYPDPAGFSPPVVAKLLPQAKVPPPAAQLIPSPKVPQPVAQLREPLLWLVPWAHHVILMDKVSDLSICRWYMVRRSAQPTPKGTRCSRIHSANSSRPTVPAATPRMTRSASLTGASVRRADDRARRSSRRRAPPPSRRSPRGDRADRATPRPPMHQRTRSVAERWR